MIFASVQLALMGPRMKYKWIAPRNAEKFQETGRPEHHWVARK